MSHYNATAVRIAAGASVTVKASHYLGSSSVSGGTMAVYKGDSVVAANLIGTENDSPCFPVHNDDEDYDLHATAATQDGVLWYSPA